MNILQIVPELKVGGVETGTVDFSRELIKDGHSAFVISAGGELVDRLQRGGTEHIQLPVHKKNIFSIIKLSFRIRKIVREKNIDIVHARSRVPAWIAFFAVKGTHAHFITTAHGYYSKHFGSRVMGWGERVIAVSSIIKDHMNETFHTPIARIRVIPRGVDLKKFSVEKKEIPDEKKEWHIGIIGRLSPIKGHIYFLKAIKEVLQIIPNVRAFVIGGASENKQKYKDELIRLTDELGIKEQVVFTGSCSDVSAILPSLDCLCMASTIPEAFGRVIVEAQAARVPVVATKIGGAIDIIEEGKTGILVEPRNAEDLAKGIIEILRNRQRTRRIVEGAYNRAWKRYSLKKMTDGILEVYHEVLKKPRILITKFSSLGDIVLISPSLRTIREKYPDAFISVVTYPQFREIFENCPYIDDLILYEREGRHQKLKGFMKLVWELRRRRYNIAIDLQNNTRSHCMIFLSKAKTRLGYSRGKRGWLLTHKIHYKKDEIDPVQSQYNVLKCLDISSDNKKLEFWVSQDDREYIKTFLKSENISEKDRLIAINLGSNPKWISKRWPLDRFVAVADRVYEKHGIRTVFIGGKDNVSLTQELSSKVTHPYIDAIGKTTITQLGALIDRTELLLTGDSAPLHIGVAMDVPAIAFFGPTNPARHAPPGKVDILYTSVKCSPCYSGECKQEVLLCMTTINEKDVFKKVETLLTQKEPKVKRTTKKAVR